MMKRCCKNGQWLGELDRRWDSGYGDFARRRGEALRKPGTQEGFVRMTKSIHQKEERKKKKGASLGNSTK